MHKNQIIINGRLLDFRKVEDRSIAFQILKDTMENCNDDYFEVTGDFKIEGTSSKDKELEDAIANVKAISEYDKEQFRLKKLGLPYDKIIDHVYR